MRRACADSVPPCALIGCHSGHCAIVLHVTAATLGAMSVSSLNFAVDGIGFSLLVQYEDREVQLTLPMATTFEQLHRLLSQHWPSAAINTLIQDGQKCNTLRMQLAQTNIDRLGWC